MYLRHGAHLKLLKILRQFFFDILEKIAGQILNREQPVSVQRAPTG